MPAPRRRDCWPWPAVQVTSSGIGPLGSQGCSATQSGTLQEPRSTTPRAASMTLYCWALWIGCDSTQATTNSPGRSGSALDGGDEVLVVEVAVAEVEPDDRVAAELGFPNGAGRGRRPGACSTSRRGRSLAVHGPPAQAPVHRLRTTSARPDRSLSWSIWLLPARVIGSSLSSAPGANAHVADAQLPAYCRIDGRKETRSGRRLPRTGKNSRAARITKAARPG